MAKQEKLPSFEETTPIAEELPSFEQTSEVPQIKPFDVGASMGAAELAARLPREAIKTATLGIAEPIFGASAAIGGLVQDLIEKNDFQGAQDVIDRAKKTYALDIERQKQVSVQYPYAAMGAETAGMLGTLLIPGVGLAAAGEQAVAKTIPQVVKEGAKIGAAFGGLGKAAEIATEAPYRPRELGEALKETGEAAVLGAGMGGIVLPAVGVATIGTLQAGENLLASTGALAKKFGLSKPMLQIGQTLTGRPVELQKRFLESEREIEKLPSIDVVKNVLDNLKKYAQSIDKTNVDEVKAAQRQFDTLTNVFERAYEKADRDTQKALTSAKDELKNIKQDLMLQKIPKAAEAVKETKMEISELGKPKDLTPYESEVTQSVVDLMDIIGNQSEEARSLIDPSYSMKRSQIEKAIVSQMNNLGIQRTAPAKAVVGEQPTTIAILKDKDAKNQLKVLLEDIRQLPQELDGQQVKDIIQKFDRAMNPREWDPASWNSALGNALKDIRLGIDRDLKYQNKDYAEKMLDVSANMDFLNKFKESFSGKSPIQQVRRAAKDLKLRELLQEMSLKTGRDLLEPLKIEQETQLYAQPRMKEELLKSSPEFQELQRLETMKDLIQANDFEQAVFNSIKDTEQAQKIISLRTDIKNLSNPEAVENQVLSQAASAEQAQQMLKAVEQRRLEFQEKIRKVIQNPVAGQDIRTALRAPMNDEMGKQSILFVEALADLPEKQFNTFFSEMGLNRPQDVKKVFDLLRIKVAMDQVKGRGSARVLLGAETGRMMAALMDLKVPAVLSWLVSYAGAIFDEFGGKIAQQYLRRVNRLDGLGTYEKIKLSSPIPLSPVAEKALALTIYDQVRNIQGDELVPIAEDRVSGVVDDINKSNLSSIEKAKAISSLNKLRMLEGKTLKKVMTQGIKPESVGISPMREGLVPKPQPQSRPRPVPALEEDRPESVQKSDLESYIDSQMRDQEEESEE